MLASTLNFLLCLLAGLMCVFVLTTRRINTTHPLALIFLTCIGMAFVAWMIDGMVSPEGVGTEELLSRAFVLIALACWTVGRIQCENGICQMRDSDWQRHRHQIQRNNGNNHGHMAGGRRI